MNLTIGKALSVSPDKDVIKALLAQRGIDLDPEVVASRFVRYLASNDHIDTIGDVMAPGCWDVSEWLANPAMQVDHDTRIKGSVAQGLNASVQPQGLVVDGFFLPSDLDPSGVADTLLKMVRAGILTDCSVGFWPKPSDSGHPATVEDRKSFGEDASWIWTSVWLKELTVCRIGMNSQAKIQAVAKMVSERTLTERDVKAISGYDDLHGLIERALFQLNPTKSVAPVSAPAPVDLSPVMAAIADMSKSLRDQQKASARMLRTKDMGTCIYMDLDSAQKMAEHCEGIATHCECMRGIIEDALPKDPNDGNTAPVPDPIPPDPTKSVTSPETKSALDGILSALQKINSKE